MCNKNNGYPGKQTEVFLDFLFILVSANFMPDLAPREKKHQK